MGIFDAFSGDAGRQAAADQQAHLKQGYSDLSGQFDQGRGDLRTSYGAALQPFQQNYTATAGGQQAYGDATGANGGAGYDRAVSQFRTSPGYQFSLDQGSENVMRNAARTGSLAGGGTQIDLQKLAQGTADQQWQGYVGNLLPYLGAANSAAGGVAGVNTGLGNQLNASRTTQGNAAYGTEAGIGNAAAQGDMADYNASQNLWNTAIGGATAAAKAYAGMPGKS